jgi:hypothetical protein
MSAAPPVRTPDARALIEWVEDRIARFEPSEEASTFDRIQLVVWREVQQRLTETLPYVEAGGLVLVTPGVSYPSALDILGLYATGEEVRTADAA